MFGRIPLVATIPFNEYIRMQGWLLLIWILLLPFFLIYAGIYHVLWGAGWAPFHKRSIEYFREQCRAYTHAVEEAADERIWPTKPATRPANDRYPYFPDEPEALYGDILPPRAVAPHASSHVVGGRVLRAQRIEHWPTSR